MPDDERKHDDATPDAGADAPASPEQPADKFRPEAIAARIDAIGEETELDRLARIEEKKLLERRKGKKGKKGLESAASKRLAKIGEGNVKRPGALADAVSPDADPLLERATRLTEWIKKNRQSFGTVVAVVVLGAAGFGGYTYWQTKHDADASALLAQGFADEHGRVATADKDDDDEEESAKPKHLYPTFKSADERRDAALAKYRDVETKYAGTGAAILARLAEAGLLLDKADARPAIAAYADVKSSALAQADLEVRGRAIEGTGFGNELLAQADPANRDKYLDSALSAFKELEQVDVKGFKELGMYHQARVLLAKGDKAKATELLKDVYKRVTDVGQTHPFPYLEFVVEDRLRELDPSAIPAKPRMGPGGMGPEGMGPGGVDTSNPQVQELIRQLQQQAMQKGGATAPPIQLPSPSK